MKLSIFLKSWKQDLGWLAYCLRFIECHWMEPETEVVLVLDQDCQDQMDYGCFGLDLHVNFVRPWPDGYSHAMWVKTHADQYCKGDLILLADSDLMLLTPGSLPDFMFEGKPIIPYQTYEEHNQMYPSSPWQKITERLTSQPAALHFMASTPILYHRSTFWGMRTKLEDINKCLYDDLVYSDQPFDYRRFATHPITLMDYDLLGWFAHNFETDRYSFMTRFEIVPSKWKQYHSWTQLPEALGVHKKLQQAFSERLRSVARPG